jgi:hypothetical protein
LPFADGKAISLTTPYALLTLDAVVREMNVRGEPPVLDMIQAAIRSAARSFGATRRLVKELAEELGPKLQKAFERLILEYRNEGEQENAAGARRSQPSQGLAVGVPEECLIVEWMNRKGDRFKAEMTSRELDQFLHDTEKEYDLVVDEHTGELRILGAEGWELISLHRRPDMESAPRGPRGMLWLALTNVGRRITEKAMREVLGIDPRAREPALYQYRSRLGELLGPNLRDKIVGERSDKVYPVAAKGWSFCWIRLDPDAHKSTLLQGLRGSPGG